MSQDADRNIYESDRKDSDLEDSIQYKVNTVLNRPTGDPCT